MARQSIGATVATYSFGYPITKLARLFERIPIQDQVHNRKSFVSRADTTAIWQRTPRPARDGELEIHAAYLQTELGDNFIPPPKSARKTQNSARSDLSASIP